MINCYFMTLSYHFYPIALDEKIKFHPKNTIIKSSRVSFLIFKKLIDHPEKGTITVPFMPSRVSFLGKINESCRDGFY